ncbi:hypothetical protein MKW94_020973 [Papaver nudicaule]|uniref:Neprosin PEP catalytic domain-containing protein n=1 Tax=Papaver nudicaule TaxID=74823 RepID=A0AA41S8Q5_PAPNU|nr:hypothetical protein [Papaver nudicaule]
MKSNWELKRYKSETSIFQTRSEKCPLGTVPIRRTRKEDLIRAKSLSLSTRLVSYSTHEYFAGVVYQNEGEKFHGASAKISIWTPNVNLDQYILAEISLRSGWDDPYNRIHVGWMVNPILYDNDTTVRNFIYWTVMNPQITPDEPVNITSTYEGKVFRMQSHVYLIGYWPAEIFPLFGDTGIDRIYWGGHSMDNGDRHAPQMGSGHFPDGDYTHDAYITHMQYNDVSGALLDPRRKRMTKVLGCKKNYDLNYLGFVEESDRRHTIQYGGPGESVNLIVCCKVLIRIALISRILFKVFPLFFNKKIP